MAGSRDFVRLMGDPANESANRIFQAVEEKMGLDRSAIRVVYLPSALRVAATDWPKLVKDRQC